MTVFPENLSQKGDGQFEGLLQNRQNSETATPIHFKIPGLIHFVKW
jgi:hypothetical protein